MGIDRRGRRAHLALGLLVALVACRQRAEPPVPPDSPVGRFEIVSGSVHVELAADGSEVHKFTPQNRTIIDVRADGTLLLASSNPSEPASNGRRLEATWGAPTPDESIRVGLRRVWTVRRNGEPGRADDSSQMPTFIGWSEAGWMVPAVDWSTRTFTGVTFARRVDG